MAAGFASGDTKTEGSGGMSDSEDNLMSETGNRTWQDPYQKAISEEDKERLGQLVRQAEAAIYERFQELQGSSNHHEERRLMKDATEQLLSLKVNRLGWPPVE
jgi:hypothetical protein